MSRDTDDNGKIIRYLAAPPVRRMDTEGQPTRTLTGYTIKWDDVYETRYWAERIERGAFAEYLASDQPTRYLDSHDPRLVLANSRAGDLTLEIDDVGLRYEATLNSSSAADDLLVRVDAGHVSGMSVGMVVEPGGEREEALPSGKSLFVIERAELWEISATDFPAYGANHHWPPHSGTTRTPRPVGADAPTGPHPKVRRKRVSEWRTLAFASAAMEAT